MSIEKEPTVEEYIDTIAKSNPNIKKSFLNKLDKKDLQNILNDELCIISARNINEKYEREFPIAKNCFKDYTKEYATNGDVTFYSDDPTALDSLWEDTNQNESKDNDVNTDPNSENTNFSAFELYNLELKEVPKLLNPFFQKVGLAALVGSSDTGKSTFLRQLALSICLKQRSFLGYPINATHSKVIYVSTEDDFRSVSFSLRRQINQLNKKEKLDVDLLKNLEFIFDPTNLLKELKSRIKSNSYDLIIVDAFTDVFGEEINSNTQVRKFLNDFDILAKKNDLLILFLHHLGKRTDKGSPSKDNIIGSQGFEAKMRSVVEIKPNANHKDGKDLWVLKANFLDNSYKNKSFELNLNENLLFENTRKRGTGKKAKSNNVEAVNKIIELHNTGLSIREIEKELKDTPYKMGKSTIGKILKENT